MEPQNIVFDTQPYWFVVERYRFSEQTGSGWWSYEKVLYTDKEVEEQIEAWRKNKPTAHYRIVKKDSSDLTKTVTETYLKDITVDYLTSYMGDSSYDSTLESCKLQTRYFDDILTVYGSQADKMFNAISQGNSIIVKLVPSENLINSLKGTIIA